ncbi:MAG: putative F420-dependent oxidoreductase [Candidatus Poriferisodalaceae bacterium]|jgi:probable F420-dependent oxidoreductase
MDLGEIGVWSGEAFFGDPDQATGLAVAAEEAGYGAMWIPGGGGGEVLERCALALEATSSLTIATGIVNIWRHDAAEVAEIANHLAASTGGRFLLGLGVSHERLIGEEYVTPLAKMRSYLDELDAAGHPPEQRCLAALRPKMLELSAARSLGTHSYFVPPEHTAAAREELGEGPLIMPEQTVLIESDPVEARAVARKFCKLYLGLPNYTNNLRDLGYTDDDIGNSGSDRLIDAIVAWGDPDTIATRVRAHHDAGADHVCIQSIGPMATADVWRELAPALLG